MLTTYINLLTKTIGDGLANILVFIAASAKLGWGVEDLFTIYTDNISQIYSIEVRDRFVVKVSEDEVTVIEPAGRSTTNIRDAARDRSDSKST